MLVATLGMLALTIGFVLTGELLATVPMQGAAPGRESETSFDPPAREVAPKPVGAASAREPRSPSARPDRIEALAHELVNADEEGRRITLVGVMRKVGAAAAAITLARILARYGSSVVLVDLAFGQANLAAISSDPAAPGLAQLIEGSASFGDVITRDRHSSVHLVTVGRATSDAEAIMEAPRLSITLEALAQSYDYLIIDASTLPEMAAERFASVAPRAVLIAAEIDDPLTIRAREQLLRAGFADVSTLPGAAGDVGNAAAQAAA